MPKCRRPRWFTFCAICAITIADNRGKSLYMATPATDIQARTDALRASLTKRRAGSDELFSRVRAAHSDNIISEDLRTVLNRVREGIRHDADMEPAESVAPGAGLPVHLRATRIQK